MRSQNAVHNLGCPVVSRVTSFETFSSNVCIFCTILNDVISHTSYFSVFGYPVETLSLGFDILHKYKGVNSIIISNILLSAGARACKALNQLEEAIKWCDEGFEVSFDNVLPDIPSILWLNNFRLMCRGREGVRGGGKHR